MFQILSLQGQNPQVSLSHTMEANPGAPAPKLRNCEINTSGPCPIHRKRVVCAASPFTGHVPMLRWKLVAFCVQMTMARLGNSPRAATEILLSKVHRSHLSTRMF